MYQLEQYLQRMFLKMTRLDIHNPVITQPSPYNPTWRVRNIHRFYSWQGCQEIIWNQNIFKFHEIKKNVSYQKTVQISKDNNVSQNEIKIKEEFISV